MERLTGIFTHYRLGVTRSRIFVDEIHGTLHFRLQRPFKKENRRRNVFLLNDLGKRKGL